MDPFLIAQIEAENHRRMQEAHMYCNAMNRESARQAHMHEAHFAAQSRFQQPRSGYCETSKYPLCSPRRENVD